jgi:hypothetical protein
MRNASRPPPASSASGARAINETGPPVAGRADADAVAVAVGLALGVVEGLALAVAVALGVAEGVALALDEPLGRHSPLSSTSSELAQSGVSSPTTSPVSGSTLSPESSWRLTPDCAKATDANNSTPSMARPIISSDFLTVSPSVASHPIIMLGTRRRTCQ